MTTVEGSAAVQFGLTPQPEGEQVPGYDPRKRGEANPGSLVKRGFRPAIPTNPPSSGGMATDPSAAASFELVRATTRFALDLRKLSPVAPKGEKRALSEEERDVRGVLLRVSEFATTARNVAMRCLVRRDSDALDQYLAKNDGRMPRRLDDWIDDRNYSYPLVRQSVPLLASGMAATIAREVDGKWSRERYEVLIRQTRSSPHFRVGQPFPVRAGDVRWVWGVEGAVATVTLLSGKAPGPTQFRLPLDARDAHQREILKRLSSGEWKAGEVRIERDRLRPAKWYLRVGYKRIVPKRTEGNAAAINRGIRCFLVSTIKDGEEWIYDGDDIVAYLAQIQRRRREYQRGVKASARVGRGRPRALKSIEHLIGKAERWRQTRCQVIARRLARWLADRKVQRVYMEDFSGIRDGLPESLKAASAYGQKFIWERIQEWPYYQLGSRLAACLTEYGIEVITIDPADGSRTCPQCGYVHDDNRDLAHWKLRCQSPSPGGSTKFGCGYSRHLDIGFCHNALARGEAARASKLNDPNGLNDGSGPKNGTARKSPGKPMKGKGGQGTGRNGKG